MRPWPPGLAKKTTSLLQTVPHWSDALFDVCKFMPAKTTARYSSKNCFSYRLLFSRASSAKRFTMSIVTVCSMFLKVCKPAALIERCLRSCSHKAGQQPLSEAHILRNVKQMMELRFHVVFVNPRKKRTVLYDKRSKFVQKRHRIFCS